MSREMKFRAWNGEKIISQDHLFWNGETFVTGVWDYTETYIHPAEQFEVSLMQSTGLKDRNGIEIYEGDALRIHHDDGESNFAGIVKWLAEGDWLGWCLMERCDPEMLRVDDQPSLEVIGNIYETPELAE